MRKHQSWMLAAGLLVAAVWPNWAQAASITVDGSTCTLDNAITSANSNADTGGCVGSGTYGDDTITLQTDVTLSAALPQIASPITIEGDGHKIDGNSLGSVLWISNSGILTLNKTVITGGNVACYCGTNGSIQYGGGIYNEGQLILTNSTVSGNRAGGIHNNMGILTINNSTVSENVLAACCVPAGCIGGGTCRKGEGIYMSGGTTTLRSSIVSGNFGLEILVSEGSITANNYNVFGHSGKSNAEAFYGFSPGTKDVNATSDGDTPTALEAILSPLADNGGYTLTHALVAGSPAIDWDPTCSTELTADQRGYIRPVGAGCDAGAYEYGAVPVFTVTPNVDTGGSITPDTAQVVTEGSTASFTVTPDTGYTIDDAVGGTCPEGNWNGSTYTTGQIDADCTVVFSFDKKANMAPIIKLLLLKH